MQRRNTSGRISHGYVGWPKRATPVRRDQRREAAALPWPSVRRFGTATAGRVTGHRYAGGRAMSARRQMVLAAASTFANRCGVCAEAGSIHRGMFTCSRRHTVHRAERELAGSNHSTRSTRATTCSAPGTGGRRRAKLPGMPRGRVPKYRRLGDVVGHFARRSADAIATVHELSREIDSDEIGRLGT